VKFINYKNMPKINLSKIIPDPDQPRKVFSKTELFELQNSIQAQGILSPIIVESNYQKDKYLLIDGERRYRCAKKLELETVPVEIIEGPLTYKERTEKRFHVQEQHSNWSELDKARAIYDYKKTSKKTLAEIAETLNLQVPKVHGYLSVTEFTEAGKKLINEHNIDFTYLIFLIRAVKHYLVISDLKQEYIEEKLILKIVSGTFAKVSDIQSFSKAMSCNNYEKLKINFLERLDFSFEDFINRTNVNKKEETQVFDRILIKLDLEISKNIEKKNFLTKNHLEMLEKIRNSINRIL